ncbi:MAG TPA: HRDC domain-containing protein, partial [Geminicoccaceae bacterium]|nr:HRDC domain-containing protein [Geminicoccaceae bacterium]
RSVLRQLAALDLVRVDVEGHGGLRLGPGCREVLCGERRIELRRDPAAAGAGRGRSAATKAAKPAAGARGVLDDAADEALFQALRARRAELARAQGVPPYVIFHDSTLVEMARRRPRDADELAALPGVGRAKLARYGPDFLATVAGHGRRA